MTADYMELSIECRGWSIRLQQHAVSATCLHDKGIVGGADGVGKSDRSHGKDSHEGVGGGVGLMVLVEGRPLGLVGACE
jgi:hypothetical protein